MKRKCRYFAAVALLVVMMISFTVPAYASGGFGGGDRGNFGGNFWTAIDWGARIDLSSSNAEYDQLLHKVWSFPSSISGTLSVSYDVLSDLCVELNMQGYPCHIARSNVAYRIVGDGYILNESSRLNIEWRYLCTTNGAVLEAATDTNVLNVLDTIRVLIDNMYTRVVNIDNALTAKDGLFDLWFSLFDERLAHLNTGMELLAGYIYGFDEDPEAPSVMSKLNDLITAVEGLSVTTGDINFDTTPITTKLDTINSTIIEAVDDSRVVTQLRSISTKLTEILNAMDDSSGGDIDVDIDNPFEDSGSIYDAIKEFQEDFDDTFSDLKRIYPTEVIETLHSGASFEWSDVDILNSVNPSTIGTNATVYRMPETLMNVSANSNGLFRIFNNGDTLPLTVQLEFDGGRFGVDTFSYDEIKTLTGTSVVVENAGFVHRVVLLGKSTQGDNPKPSGTLGGSLISPVSGSWPNGIPSANVQHDSSNSNNVFALKVDDSIHAKTASGNGIKVSSGGNYTDSSGQQWLCDEYDYVSGVYTKRVGVITFDGSEDEGWVFSGTSATNPYFYIYTDVNDPAAASRHNVMSDRFTYIANVDEASLNSRGVNLDVMDGRSSFVFGVGTMCGTLDKWCSLLAAEPVTVYYPLAEPERYDLSLSNYVEVTGWERFYVEDSPQALLSVSYSNASPYVALFNDAEGNWYKESSDGTSVKLSNDLGEVDTLNAAFNFKRYSNAADIKFSAGTNHVWVANGDLTVDYVKGSKFFNWLYLYLSNLNVGSVDADALLKKLDDIENALSKMDSDTNIDIENNTNIDINNDNDSYNVFYVTDPETGEETSIIDLTGNVLTAFGKLLNFLYQIGFEDALSNFGDTVDGLTDFYLNSGEGSVDVWAS